MSTTALAWQLEHVALFCSLEKSRPPRVIFRSFGTVPFGRRFAHSNVFIRGTVAGLAVDARLFPDRMVRIGLQVIVRGDLADVASVTGCVEGVLPVLPVYRFIRLTRKVAHPARSHVEPFLLVHVVRHGQSLEPTAIQGGKEVVDILAPHHVVYPVFLLAFGASFNDPAGLAGDVRTVPRVSDNDVFRLRGELARGPIQRYTAAWPARDAKVPTTGRISRGICGNLTEPV